MIIVAIGVISLCQHQCDFNIHLECVPIPLIASHKYHRHPLILKDSVVEDESTEYYCDICEEERNPEHHVYNCEKCTYIAHMKCVLMEEKTSSPEEILVCNSGGNCRSMDRKPLLENIMTEQTADQQSEFPVPQIQHFSHQHVLNFEEVIDKSEDLYCNACHLELLSPAYSFPQRRSGLFMCDECRDLSTAFVFLCLVCNFKLDMKCATALAAPRYKDQRAVKDMEKEPKLFHFNHGHKMVFGNEESVLFSFNDDHKMVPGNCGSSAKEFKCNGCCLSILGPAYSCLDCDFILHESCFALPKEIQCPSHPSHSLEASQSRSSPVTCHACGYGFSPNDIGYGCNLESDLYFHYLCVKSLRRPLKSSSHEHDLYYFGVDGHQMLAYSKGAFIKHFNCSRCSRKCSGPSYHCVKCKISFHLECVQIPEIVKSKYHIHPFILKDSFIEDDSGEYYCDICEEERNGKDHVYYCKECGGQFVAHIECVFNKVEEIFSYLPLPSAVKESTERYDPFIDYQRE
ncbi:hypothetical protein DITRI_Ditri20bG0043200 [Diplodiscus trichospermus]